MQIFLVFYAKKRAKKKLRAEKVKLRKINSCLI
jgi:hypothetical protein